MSNQHPPPYNPGVSPYNQPQHWQQPAPQPQPLPHGGTPYVIPARPFNHGGHLIADVCTLGLWFPMHLLLWAVHPRKSTVVYPDGHREKR